MSRLCFRMDELTASGAPGQRARLGLLALQLLADPRLRARLREQWVAERSSGDRLALVKLALRARLGDANTPLPTDSHDQEATS
jgi:hypothetical protein